MGSHGKPLRPQLRRDGYLSVTPMINGKSRPIAVHRLIGEAFLGPIPAGHVTNHKDHDRLNNRVENLEYVTQAENVAKAIARGRKGGVTGERHFRARLTPAIVREIRDHLPSHANAVKLASVYGVDESTIRAVMSRKTWGHVE